MPHIHHFEVENFRVFSDRTSFEFAPITVLTGTNSAGKSSLIRAMMLLRNSLDKNLNLSRLTFSQTEGLGAFSDSLNKKNAETDPYIKFVLPLSLDYLEGNFELEVWFSKETSGIKANGELVFFHIYRIDTAERITIFECSLLPLEFLLSNNLFSGIDTVPLDLRDQYKDSYSHRIKINLKYFKDELDRTFDNIQVKRELEDAENHLDKKKKDGGFFFSSSEISEEIMAPFKTNFYEDTSSRNLMLYDKHRRKIREDEVDWNRNEALIFRYYPIGRTSNDGVFTTYGLDRYSQFNEETISKLLTAENLLIQKVFEGISLLLDPFMSDVGWLWMLSYASEDPDIETTIKSTIRSELRKCLQTVQEGLEWSLSDEFTRYGYWLIEQLIVKNITNAMKSLKSTLKINYLGSNRGLQQRFYAKGTNSAGFHDLIEEYIQLNIEYINVIKNFIKYWIKQLGIGDEIYVEVANSGLTKALFLKRDDRKVNLADLGFGVSQLIPILLNIAISAKKNAYEWDTGAFEPGPSIICIEEPEANLHPALQSKLADLFIDAAHKFKIQFIIETHSEYFIRKLQYWMAKKAIKPEATAIYYFYDPENVPPGEEQVKRIEIAEDGKLTDDFGTGFFDEADKIAISIWNLTQATYN